MAERPDERLTNEGMGDRGGAARHRREPNPQHDERWPEEGFGDRGGAARKKVIEGGSEEPGDEPGARSGFWSSKPSDDEAGYGGGRERVEELNKQSFGETGWGGGRGPTGPPPEQGHSTQELPESVEPVPNSPDWDERHVRENGDKSGQSGGHPIEPRGPAQSNGGYEHREQSLGDTRDISPRGGYGQRETEEEQAAKK